MKTKRSHWQVTTTRWYATIAERLDIRHTSAQHKETRIEGTAIRDRMDQESSMESSMDSLTFVVRMDTRQRTVGRIQINYIWSQGNWFKNKMNKSNNIETGLANVGENVEVLLSSVCHASMKHFITLKILNNPNAWVADTGKSAKNC